MENLEWIEINEIILPAKVVKVIDQLCKTFNLSRNEFFKFALKDYIGWIEQNPDTFIEQIGFIEKFEESLKEIDSDKLFDY